jgi:hypothetical protein
MRGTHDDGVVIMRCARVGLVTVVSGHSSVPGEMTSTSRAPLTLTIPNPDYP